MSFMAGHYTATYDGHNIGTTRNGFNLVETPHEQPINTDDGGDTMVDSIGRGQDVEVELDYVDWDLISTAFYKANPQGDPYTNVGKLATGRAKTLVLTAAAGSIAAAHDAGTPYSFSKALIITDIRTVLANRLREAPLRFHCYPDPITKLAYTGPAAGSGG